MQKILVSILAVVLFGVSFYTPNSAQSLKTQPKFSMISKQNEPKNTYVTPSEEIYSALHFEEESTLNPEVFEKAYRGFQNLKLAGALDEASHILSICDFSLSSTKKRLWIIDLEKKEILFNALVAHGKNTGDEYAKNFSNTESSLQSSMGFFVTESTYNGSNGYSLKLIGMDPGFNDAALRRAIVMHGADYVSENFIKSQHRIGRSWGCPAVPRALAEPIINTIKGKNCLFIYYPDQNFEASSQWLKDSVQGQDEDFAV